MGVQVAFNYQQWVTRYPEFASVDENLVNDYFTEATIYHRNDGSGPIKNPAIQLMLLNMVTAHICQLNAPPETGPNPDGAGGPQLVGPITSASEGSVSVGTSLDQTAGGPSQQWWVQTKYGFAYWQATANYRTMHYKPNLGRPTQIRYPWIGPTWNRN